MPQRNVAFLNGIMSHYAFSILLMQGTLLNSKSQISISTAEALKEASSRGVKVVIATGKVRKNFVSTT